MVLRNWNFLKITYCKIISQKKVKSGGAVIFKGLALLVALTNVPFPTFVTPIIRTILILYLTSLENSFPGRDILTVNICLILLWLGTGLGRPGLLIWTWYWPELLTLKKNCRFNLNLTWSDLKWPETWNLDQVKTWTWPERPDDLMRKTTVNKNIIKLFNYLTIKTRKNFWFKLWLPFILLQTKAYFHYTATFTEFVCFLKLLIVRASLLCDVKCSIIC